MTWWQWALTIAVGWIACSAITGALWAVVGYRWHQIHEARDKRHTPPGEDGV